MNTAFSLSWQDKDSFQNNNLRLGNIKLGKKEWKVRSPNVISVFQ